MSIEEIDRVKADVLLEFQKAEDRVMDLRSEARELAGKIEGFAKLLYPSDTYGKTGALAVNAPNVAALRDEKFRDALNYETGVRLAQQLEDAIKQLANAQQKKIELRLR